VLRLAGGDNVRDLGGLETRDGRHTRGGRLFRGALLASLVGADVELLIDRVGLRTVVDLRSSLEIAHAPGSWSEHGVEWINCPFRLGRRAALPGPGVDNVAAYMGFLDADHEPVVVAARRLMDPSSHPALFHCAAGKDRTGVLSALLLDVLGVQRQAIADDYALTTEALPRVLERLGALEPYRAMLAGTTAADHEPRAEDLIGFLQLLDERHGGAEEWLLGHGLAAGVIERFRSAVLQ
jgi:hypothetical protein